MTLIHLNAYALALPIINDPSHKLSVDDIKMIHKACMSGVSLDIGRIRNNDELTVFGVPKRTSSLHGLAQLLDQQRLNNYFSITMNKQTSTQPAIQVSGTNLEKMSKLQKSQVDNGCFYIYGYYGKNKDTINEIITKELTEFYEKTSELNESGASVNEIIIAIVSLVQSLERIHPFMDGNCRTLCSVMELVCVVKEGMNKTIQLCHSAKLASCEESMADTQKWYVLPQRRPFLERCSNQLVSAINNMCSPTSPITDSRSAIFNSGKTEPSSGDRKPNEPAP